MKYRPDIDGLRTLAVVPVILFHAGATWLPGGFIGVDVFFVISGYLITTIIVCDLEAGRFSFASFYERRARRILPALIVMITFCMPLAWFWMLPQELESFGKSIAATSLFVSNVLFWKESGYFDPATDLKPLLHTWSLAVEEQYYLLFPIVLLLLWRFGRRSIIVALVLAIMCSLILAEWGWRIAPSAAFYLAPTRIWEILIGSLSAFLTLRKQQKNQFLSLLGLMMILGSIVGFGPSIPMPSIWTAIPVVGAALVLVFGTAGTWTANILSLRVLVAIGLLSYSAYLWHQPLLAFARIRSITEPSNIQILAIIGVTFLFAWLSWRYIETPFRGKSGLLNRRGVFAASSATMIVLPLIGVLLIATGGADWRQTPAGMRYSDIALREEILVPNYGMHISCDSGVFTALEHCQTDKDPEVVLWGDSFAMHLVQALESSKTSISFAQATYSQCGPIMDLAAQGSVTTWHSCMAFNDAVFKWILHQPSIRIVILSSPFRQTERDIYRRDGAIISDPLERRSEILKSFRNISHVLAQHGKSLVIVSPPAQNGIDLGLCSIRRQAMGVAEDACNFYRSDYEIFSRSMINLLDAAESYIPVIWLPKLTCSTGICAASYNGVPLYRDHGHLSAHGSSTFGKRFDLVGQIEAAATRFFIGNSQGRN